MLLGTAEYINNEYTVGGVNIPDLAAEYGTPLIVYDVTAIRNRIRAFQKVFNDQNLAHRVVYASKAFCTLAMYQILEEEGTGCDIVSGGEIYTALHANMPVNMMEFHGNNKSYEELEYAIESGVGTIIVDNFHEIDLLNEIMATRPADTTQNVIFRIAPGVSAETHDYDVTGQVDSKFGFDVLSGQAHEALVLLQNSPQLNLEGLHCHIGSQIFSTEGFLMAAEKMIDILNQWRESDNFTAQILNMGGGFGIRYKEGDDPVEPEVFVEQIVAKIRERCDALDYPLPEIWIEPGRSIVAEAGTTIYEVGSTKFVPGIRNFLAVNGGMGDNIRPALYQAEYTAFPVVVDDSRPAETVRLVGKYCESGDILVHNATMQHFNAGELLGVNSTGAYGYSMASNYNRNPRPAVVFVENGKSRLVIRRETYADMMQLDVPLENSGV